MASAFARGALVALALVAGAWLVLGFRALELEADGVDVLERAQRGEVPPDVVSRGLSDLRSAQRLNADQSPLLNEGLLLAQTGRGRQGIAIAERVIAEEPDHLNAWIFLYLAARPPYPPDPKRAKRALRMVETLDPRAGDVIRARFSGSS